MLFDQLFICFITGQDDISTVSIVFVNSYDKIVSSTYHIGESRTLTNPKFIETNFGGNLENRIQTIWQFILIILAVLSLLAFAYIGKCLHRQWTFRSLQVSNTNASAPESALDMRNEIECFYEQIQNIEYEDPDRYLTAAQDDSHRDGIYNSQEKIDALSIKSVGQSIEPSNIEPRNRESKSENVMYENQPNNGVRETDDLYLTPIM